VFSTFAALGVSDGDFLAMAAAQAILGGLVLVLAAVFRLGFLADFLSQPVLAGFVGGLALDILLSQIAKMLGIGLGDGGFFAEAVRLIGELSQLHPASVLIGACSLALLLVGNAIERRIPWALVVLVGATIATSVWSLDDHGVAVLGPVESGLPVLEIPRLHWSQWVALLPSAVALAMITLSEGLLISRAYAERHGYAVNLDRDLLAFGAANVTAGFSASFTIGSSTSRSAAMDQAGSRTQLPSIVLAVGTLVLLLFGTSLLELVPLPAIGAVVAVAVLRLIGVREFVSLWRLSRSEFLIGALCLFGVLIIGPLQGLIIAFLFSAINVTRRAANPPIDVLADGADPGGSLLDHADEGSETAPGVVVLRVAAPIFFANAAAVAARIRTAALVMRRAGGYLVLDMEAVTDIDVTGAQGLRASLERLRDDGLGIAYTRLRPDLRARLDSFGLMSEAVEFPTNRAAVTELARR
jgi:MFS superfamily sulfate permease-like transporter